MKCEGNQFPRKISQENMAIVSGTCLQAKGNSKALKATSTFTFGIFIKQLLKVKDQLGLLCFLIDLSLICTIILMNSGNNNLQPYKHLFLNILAPNIIVAQDAFK